MQLGIAVAMQSRILPFFKLLLLVQAFLDHIAIYAVYYFLLFSTAATITYVCVELQK
jgi:hypothetical protein